MEWNDWLLALHVLSAFALAAAIVFFWVVVLALRRAELPAEIASVGRLLPIGSIVVGIGSVGALVFGIWLAISLDGVQVWDGWVIAAIVIWVVAAETGRRSGVAYGEGAKKAAEHVAAGQTGPDAEAQALVRSSRALLLHTVATVSVILILADMIWKPGS
jgi:hypothetical protein